MLQRFVLIFLVSVSSAFPGQILALFVVSSSHSFHVTDWSVAGGMCVIIVLSMFIEHV